MQGPQNPPPKDVYEAQLQRALDQQKELVDRLNERKGSANKAFPRLRDLMWANNDRAKMYEIRQNIMAGVYDDYYLLDPETMQSKGADKLPVIDVSGWTTNRPEVLKLFGIISSSLSYAPDVQTHYLKILSEVSMLDRTNPQVQRADVNQPVQVQLPQQQPNIISRFFNAIREGVKSNYQRNLEKAMSLTQGLIERPDQGVAMWPLLMGYYQENCEACWRYHNSIMVDLLILQDEALTICEPYILQSIDKGYRIEMEALTKQSSEHISNIIQSRNASVIAQQGMGFQQQQQPVNY